MASSSFSCDVCVEPYNGKNKKPRVLPCGHTFCEQCLQSFEGTLKACPKCRREWSGNTDSLVSCYQLIPTDDADNLGATSSKNSVCEEHNFELAFWCNLCRKNSCKVCVSTTHHECGNSSNEIGSKLLQAKEKIQVMTNSYSDTIKVVDEFSTEMKKFGSTSSSMKRKIEDLGSEIESKLQSLDNGKLGTDSPDMQCYVNKLTKILSEFSSGSNNLLYSISKTYLVSNLKKSKCIMFEI